MKDFHRLQIYQNKMCQALISSTETAIHSTYDDVSSSPELCIATDSIHFYAAHTLILTLMRLRFTLAQQTDLADFTSRDNFVQKLTMK